MTEPQKRRFLVKHTIKNFAKCVPNIGISQGFWLIKEENGIYNIHSKFQDHTSNVAQGKVVPPFCHQMTVKDIGWITLRV